jgi:hypothetical protein
MHETLVVSGLSRHYFRCVKARRTVMNHPKHLSQKTILGLFKTSWEAGAPRDLIGLKTSSLIWDYPGTTSRCLYLTSPPFLMVCNWFTNFALCTIQCSLATQAAVFKGEPLCFFGDCAICLRLGKGLYGLGISASCPLGANAKMAHLGAAANSNNCKAYRFQEIACLKGVAAAA